MAQQTAIDWLIEQRSKYGLIIMQDLEQAKEMEKEQIKDAFKHGELPQLFDILSAEQYYTETYNK